jgi:pimeloyl-ACP methyl ester carboxylesterase
VSSRHLDGRLVSERRTHSTANGHSPIDANAHRTRRSSNSLNGSFFWRDPSRGLIILPLAEKFTVIAPDLPGIGDSSIPKDGMDMKTAAIRIHALAKSLHVDKARVVGHDIGLMVAYAYAAQFPTETEKLVGVVSCLYALDHQSELAGLICESFAFQTPAPDFALAVLKGLSHLAPHAHGFISRTRIFRAIRRRSKS